MLYNIILIIIVIYKEEAFNMSEERQIKFKYVFAEDYNPVYCNGAFGGISTHGEIVANFFLERMPIPNSMTNLVNPDGSLGGVVSVDPETLDETIIRHVSTGIVLNEESAKAIYAWLGNQIQELENRKSLQTVVETKGE